MQHCLSHRTIHRAYGCSLRTQRNCNELVQKIYRKKKNKQIQQKGMKKKRMNHEEKTTTKKNHEWSGQLWKGRSGRGNGFTFSWKFGRWHTTEKQCVCEYARSACVACCSCAAIHGWPYMRVYINDTGHNMVHDLMIWFVCETHFIFVDVPVLDKLSRTSHYQWHYGDIETRRTRSFGDSR